MQYPVSPCRQLRGFTLIELLAVIAIIGVLAGILIPAIGSIRDKAEVSTSTSNLRQIGAALNLYANDNQNKFPPINDTSKGTHGEVWFVALMPYLVDFNRDASEMGSTDMTAVYRCPVYYEYWKQENPDAPESSWNQMGYGMSFRMVYDDGWPYASSGTGAQDYATPRTLIENPAKTVAVGPAPSWNLNFQRYAIDDFIDPEHGIERAHRHGDFGIYLMADGSVHQLEATREALLPYVAN